MRRAVVALLVLLGAVAGCADPAPQPATTEPPLTVVPGAYVGRDAQRGVIAPRRPPRCRVILVVGSGGQSQYVTVC